MATREECEAALDRLVEKLGEVDPALKRGHDSLERSVSCRVPDLDTMWTGQLRDGHLHEVTEREADEAEAQIRLTVCSDDLVELSSGELSFAGAWASGRLKVSAGVRDLLRLRTLL